MMRFCARAALRRFTTPLAMCAVFAALPSSTLAQTPIEPTVHWAYASFFGTGWYKINDQRDSFILRVAPRWETGEAGFDADGNRQIGYTFRVPFTIGVARLDFEDIPGIIDPDNLTTANLNFGLDADIPVNRNFSVRPSAELGYGTVLGESDSAWVYRADLRGRYTFRPGNLEWALLGGIGFAGFTPDEGISDDFVYASVGAEFTHPLNWHDKENRQMLLHWHLSYTDFLDEVTYETGVDEFGSVANFWQIGAAIGKDAEPIRIWRLKFDRLGLAYNISTTGELRGIKFVFRSLYEL